MPPCQSLENDDYLERGFSSYPQEPSPLTMLAQCTDNSCCDDKNSPRLVTRNDPMMLLSKCADPCCDENSPRPRRPHQSTTRWHKAGYFVSLAFLLAVALFALHRQGVFHVIVEIVLHITRVVLKDTLFAFFAYIQDLGAWGSVILCFVYALCTVFFIPVTVLNLAAGFCFGLWQGFVSVSCGGVIGASAAFLLGRHCLRGWVRHAIDNDRSNFSTVDTMLRRSQANTFRIVCLSRLPPCLPFPCVNYSYALTDVPFWTYFWATWLGLAPGTFAYVYMGSAFRNLAEVVSGKTGSYANTIMMIVGVVTTVGISAFLMREAQKALEINGSASEKEPLAGGTPPMEARGTPRSRKSSPSHQAISIERAVCDEELEDDIAERALDREGEWLLFTASKSTKPSRSRQRTLTRNSSVWSLFSQGADSKCGAYRKRNADRRLEYFL